MNINDQIAAIRRGAELFQWPTLGNYSEEVKLWGEMAVWCDENLQNNWNNTSMGILIYEKTDAMAFKLRWS